MHIVNRTTTWGGIGGGEKCTRRGWIGGTPGFKVQYSQRHGDFNLRAKGHNKRTFIVEDDGGDKESTRREDGRSAKGVDQAWSQMNEGSPTVKKVDTTKELIYLFRPSNHQG